MGERNHNWKGGKSEYEDHGEFKRARLKVLEAADYKCTDCGGIAKEVHHKDRTRKNHHPDNLIPLCKKCHKKYDRVYTSKYRRIYGYTLDEMAQLLSVSMATISKRIKKGALVLPKKWGPVSQPPGASPLWVP